MTHPMHPDPILLDERVTLTVRPKEFRHAYTYQAPIRSDFGGRVSGGGTRGGTVVKPGFCLHITNNEPQLRSYYFSVGIFSDHARKIIKQTIPRHVAHVHPGHTLAVDVELAEHGDYAAAYLIDFVISSGNDPLAHFTPDASLAEAAGPIGHGAMGQEVDFFDVLVGAEMLLIGLAIGSTAHFGMHIGTKMSWLLGLSAFFGGLYLMRRTVARHILCALISLLWGLNIWHFAGLLEGIGGGALAWFVHWWLRSPARERQAALKNRQNAPTKEY